VTRQEGLDALLAAGVGPWSLLLIFLSVVGLFAYVILTTPGAKQDD
jgi:hypothetical protein